MKKIVYSSSLVENPASERGPADVALAEDEESDIIRMLANASPDEMAVLVKAVTKMQAMFRGRKVRASISREQGDKLWYSTIKPVVTSIFKEVSGGDTSIDLQEFVRWLNDEWKLQRLREKGLMVPDDDDDDDEMEGQTQGRAGSGDVVAAKRKRATRAASKTASKTVMEEEPEPAPPTPRTQRTILNELYDVAVSDFRHSGYALRDEFFSTTFRRLHGKRGVVDCFEPLRKRSSGPQRPMSAIATSRSSTQIALPTRPMTAKNRTSSSSAPVSPHLVLPRPMSALNRFGSSPTSPVSPNLVRPRPTSAMNHTGFGSSPASPNPMRHDQKTSPTLLGRSASSSRSLPASPTNSSRSRGAPPTANQWKSEAPSSDRSLLQAKWAYTQPLPASQSLANAALKGQLHEGVSTQPLVVASLPSSPLSKRRGTALPPNPAALSPRSSEIRGSVDGLAAAVGQLVKRLQGGGLAG